jgi:hypothetical protein
MGAANSSNVAETVQESVMDFNTNISTSASASQSSSNTAEQYCSNTRIVAKGGASVEVCNSNVKQSISSSQLNENIQQAQVKNKAFSELQQKMDQAARSTVSGFNFGNFSNASNALRQAMSVSTSISNDIAQNCNTENSSINKAFQKCDNTDITATDGAKVRACSMDVIQDQIMKQVASCSQEAAASNTAVHDLKQEATQSAVAETKGFDMLAAIIVAIIVGGIILLALTNTFKQLLKPAKLLMIMGAASMVGAIILLIIYFVLNGKLKDQLPPMLTTGFPSDREFFNPVGMS